MIRALKIENYALITSLEIQFHRGFSVITGETGAGKSILLGAIGLLLGQRAETRMIKTGAKRCLIEATFDVSDDGLDDFFTRHDFDFDGHTCIIRRELTATGKSRAFINDTPAQVTQLRELGAQLIDIHSQHQNLMLDSEDFQLSVLDTLAHDETQRANYTLLFRRYQQACSEVEMAEKELEQNRQDEDYLRYQLQQLDELQLEEGRQEAMEQEEQMLSHAEEIRTALWAADSLMQGDRNMTQGVISTLHDVESQLRSIASMMSGADELLTRLDTCLIELKDIENEMSAQAERIDVDPARLETIDNWLSHFYAALKKFHVNDEAALMTLSDQFRQKLANIDSGDDYLQQLRQQRQAAYDLLMQHATELTALRQQAAQLVEQQMHELLIPLGIPNVHFSVIMQQRQEPTATGIDQVEFLFSANKNSPQQRIAEVASGGEIARVMLALKAMISGAMKLPTIIFDEIDTGVSGHIAERMALMMRQMGNGGRQVISITHLPQIASVGTHHYHVYKKDEEDGTTSHIEELDAEQRVNELAHMLSGAQLTTAAIENARVLLQNAQKNYSS